MDTLPQQGQRSRGGPLPPHGRRGGRGGGDWGPRGPPEEGHHQSPQRPQRGQEDHHRQQPQHQQQQHQQALQPLSQQPPQQQPQGPAQGQGVSGPQQQDGGQQAQQQPPQASSRPLKGVPSVVPDFVIPNNKESPTAPVSGSKFPEAPNLMQKFSEMTGGADDIISKGKELIFMKFGLGK
ncbi:DNA translocase FtsK-like [Schistocerca americana]|uniref:DNA translocase FtsK-like n=1 Tax=Schistocerca americana TaxID=7009 RepID=UPI001F4F616F|nr:DNA translocase FtsK-like [Schistocerca americana]XP_047098468.1 DNA translocase FtsK-like [Schistocerca piceifrons]